MKYTQLNTHRFMKMLLWYQAIPGISFGRISAVIALILMSIFLLLSGIGIEAGNLTFAHPALAATEPDLTITAITLSPEQPEAGETVTLSIIVENRGTDNADNSRLTGTLDGEKVLSVLLNPIASGTSITKTFAWQAKAGDHSFVAFTDANDVVAESDENNNSATITFSTLAADLIVESITWAPQSVSLGDVVTFTVLIENTGDVTSAWSSVEVLIDGISHGQYDVPRIPPADSVTASFSWKAREGEHLISAVVDPSGRIPENDETNNELLVSYSTDSPDLVINDITWSLLRIAPEPVVAFSIEVGNIGQAKSNSAFLVYYIDDIDEDKLFYGPINANSKMSKTFNLFLGHGAHSISAMIDCNNNIYEADETNNERTVNFTTLLPDLTLFVNRVQPDNKYVGDNVTVRMDVKNIGRSKADQCKIEYYLDGKLVKQGNIEAIEADSSIFDEYVFTAQSASHKLKAIIDPENLIMEEDETNNTREFDLNNDIKADLILADIATSPESPNIGEMVNITTTIKNVGSGPAFNSDVVFYIDDTENGLSQINDLNSGEETSVTFNWIAQAGAHPVKIVADASDCIWEIDESNNEKSLVLIVLPGEEPENISELTKVTIPSSELSDSLADVSATISGKITEISIGEHLILSMRAVNSGSINVNCNADLILPDGMSIVSPYSELTRDNTYTISFYLEAGKEEQVDIHIEAIHDGIFIIEGQFAPNSASTRSFSIPVRVKSEKDSSWQLFENGYYMIGVIVGVVITLFLVILAYIRHSRTL